MENLTLQQLINQTKEALIEAGASNYYQNVFKTLTKQLCSTQKNITRNLSVWILDRSF